MFSIIIVLSLVALCHGAKVRAVNKVVETIKPYDKPIIESIRPYAYDDTIVETIQPLAYGNRIIERIQPDGPYGETIVKKIKPGYETRYPYDDSYGHPYGNAYKYGYDVPLIEDGYYPEYPVASVEGNGAWIPGAGYIKGYPFTYMTDSYGGHLPPGGDNTYDAESYGYESYDSYGNPIVEKVIAPKKVLAPYSSKVINKAAYYNRRR